MLSLVSLSSSLKPKIFVWNINKHDWRLKMQCPKCQVVLISHWVRICWRWVVVWGAVASPRLSLTSESLSPEKFFKLSVARKRLSVSVSQKHDPADRHRNPRNLELTSQESWRIIVFLQTNLTRTLKIISTRLSWDSEADLLILTPVVWWRVSDDKSCWQS